MQRLRRTTIGAPYFLTPAMAEHLKSYPKRRDTPALLFMQLDAGGAGSFAASDIIDDLRSAITSPVQTGSGNFQAWYRHNGEKRICVVRSSVEGLTELDLPRFFGMAEVLTTEFEKK